MSRTISCTAIILKTYDVGEADRFCILLTRERGRLAARCRGARRPGSRMGGAALPFRRIDVTLTETGAGLLISAAKEQGTAPPGGDLRRFLVLEQCTEMLLALLQDGEEHPELFDCVTELLTTDAAPSSLSFGLRVLGLLGHLPPDPREEIYGLLHPEGRDFVGAALSARWSGAVLPSSAEERRLWQLCQRIIQDQSGRTLRSVVSA